MQLWDDANLLLMGSHLDPTRAVELMRQLLDCADKAHDAGFLFGERQLRRAAGDLQARLRP